MRKKALILLSAMFFLNTVFTKEEANIYLNFENASLNSVVNYLAEQKKINYIPHKDLAKQKVSLTTREPLTLDRSWNVLLTLLEMHGFSLINVNNVHRIVKNKDNKREPLPFYSSHQGVMPKDLPDSDLVVRYIYILKNISTDVAGKILKDLLGANKVKTTKELSTCIITDKCHNIKSAMKIIEELDTGGLRESIKIIKLHHTSADEVAKLFEKHILDKKTSKTPLRFIGPQQQKEIAHFSRTTKIIPEKRQNALILLGLVQNIDKIIDFINKYIDIPMEQASSRIHIKELKYVEAPTVEKILKKIIQPPTGKKKGPLVGEFKFFEDVVIEAEKPERNEGNKKISKGSGNRLIVACSKDDWRRLEQIIDKFDKPQPQVALETMIVDIDDTKVRELGAQIRGKTGKSLAKGLTVFTSNLNEITRAEDGDLNTNIINTAVIKGTPGVTSVSIGAPGDVWSVIRSYFKTSHTNIISQPFIVTSNNEPCSYHTSETRVIPGEIEIKDGKSYQKQEEVSAKTQIDITPRINLSGLIDLKIKVAISEFLAVGTEDAPPRSTRLMETRSSMATGEVLVLGGLTREKVTVNQYKTPIFGDIPILGNLFKHKTKGAVKTNLYIFLRPSLIMPKFGGGADEYTQLKLDYAKYQIFNAETLRKTKDPIERWFFRPDKGSVDQKLKDLRKGVFRPIDSYAEGKTQPRMVQIERDPYYRATEEIDKLKKREAEKQEQKKSFLEKKQSYLLPSLRKRNKKPPSPNL